MDILSSFDSYCGSSVSCYFLWGSGSIVFLVCAGGAAASLSGAKVVFNKMLDEVYSSVKGVEGNKVSGVCLSLSSLFLLIVMLNMASLVPFGFGLSMHLSASLFLSLLLWGSLLVSGFRVSSGKSLSVLVPTFSPLWMAWFLSAVELVSVLCRPLTLGARLMINLTAGHMILVMLGSGAIYSGLETGFFDVISDATWVIGIVYFWWHLKKEVFNLALAALGAFSFLVLEKEFSKKKAVKLLLDKYLMVLGCGVSMGVLLVMEVGMSVLQTYIFCSLLCLYSNEHPS